MRKQKASDSPSARMQRRGGPRTLNSGGGGVGVGVTFVPPPSRSCPCWRGCCCRCPQPILPDGTGRWPVRRRWGGGEKSRGGTMGTTTTRAASGGMAPGGAGDMRTSASGCIPEERRLEESGVIDRIESSASDRTCLSVVHTPSLTSTLRGEGTSSGTRCTASRSHATQQPRSTVRCRPSGEGAGGGRQHCRPCPKTTAFCAG